jgi:molybdopterin synthase sulfur carrier subunit
MTINILYFAHFGDIAGRQTETLSVADGSSVKDLVDMLAARDRRLGEMLGYGRASVNAEWATPETILTDGAEVAFMPPMSGG